MNNKQHRCMNQASDSESQTQQRSLNSSSKDNVDSPMVEVGGQLLNGSTSIHPNASTQPLFTSVIYCSWCTTFAPLRFLTVSFYHAWHTFTTAASEQFTNLAVSEMLPPLARKPMIMPLWTSDK
ncbi:hypothetical protein TNCV_4179511 [Trichonephila clavipes]|nr:hypothetical protein TNCV_4179511 [Trichonephila clavipes]